MQRQQLWMSVIIFAAIFVAWTAYMGYANTRATTLEIQVAGQVDNVLIYKADPHSTAKPTNPVAEIITRGAAQQQVIRLRNSDGYSFLAQTPAAEYYFVARADTNTFESPVICCTLALADSHQTLIIDSVRDFRQTTP